MTHALSARLPDVPDKRTRSVAVIGAGVSGAACVAGLRSAGFEATVFDGSSSVGGRMATRQARWLDAAGVAHEEEFDPGCGQFRVTRARFAVVVERAVKLGFAAHWRQHVHAPFPAPRYRHVVVPTPDMPALCRHLLADTTLRLAHTVTALQRVAGGWLLRVAHGAAETHFEGPFDSVVLALPPAQAARLLGPHCPDWAGTLASVRATPCWTLMAVSDDIDWPWDSALQAQGDLARISRNDRKPGRTSSPGCVPWVAQATPAWSLAHLNDNPAEVERALIAALAPQLSSLKPLTWHHTSVHQWRPARVGRLGTGAPDCLWDAASGLGVCGDAFGDGNVEAAWSSGDELADAISGSFDAAAAQALLPEPRTEIEPARDLALLDDLAH